MFLNQGDGAGRRITVSVSVTTAHGPVRVELAGLVEAAVFAPGHHVGWKAHNAAAMQRTLDDNALWLRRLMPTLLEPAGLDLVRKAAERPKRRPPDIKWRYA